MKVIKYFATSPNFEEARERFYYESGDNKKGEKNIGLKCYQTIPRSATILCTNLNDFNEYKDLFEYLNEVPPSDDWFSYAYIDAEVNMILDKTE